MPKTNLLILKLGGSLITNKHIEYSPNQHIIDRILGEITQSLLIAKDTHIILTHGSGSFAHTSAHRYNINKGYIEPESLVHCVEVQKDSEQIATILKTAAIRHSLPTLSLSPTACFFRDSNGSLHAQGDIISKALDLGFIPHLWGAMILDENKHFSVLSADRILSCLAFYFKEQSMYSTIKLIHIGNYPGVWDSNKEVIPCITSQNWDQVKAFLSASDTKDVTGGMKGKVEELIDVAKKGIPSQIIDGTAEGNLYNAMISPEKGNLGTRIEWNRID